MAKVTMTSLEFAKAFVPLAVAVGQHKEDCKCSACYAYDQFKVIWDREIK